MALILGDRIKETTTVAGTGTATLLGATTGFQSFAAVGNGNTTYYCIADQGGPNWEVGIGTYTASGTTLARTTVLASSNAGALVVFTTGVKDVFVTYPSEKGVWYDASGNVLFTGTTTAANLAYTGTLTGSTGILNIGSGQVYKDASGNVGIGVSNPSSYGILTAYSASNPTLTIASGNANAYLRLNTTSDLNMYLTNTGGSMTMNTANTERMRINSLGNVGIGTSSPSARLSVQQSTSDATVGASFRGYTSASGDGQRTFITQYVDSTVNYYAINQIKADSHQFYTSNTERMRIDSSGNVGIGTSSPSTKLTVAGAITITGAFALRGSYGAGAIASNFAAGDGALNANTTGTYNSAVGQFALYSNTTGTQNSAMGHAALYSNTTGYNNSAMGQAALQNNTTGYSISAVGQAALNANTTGANNSAMGAGALQNNTTGYSNSAVGMSALYSNTTGNYNSAMGHAALYSNTTGTQNSAMGHAALYSNTTGNNNSAVGQGALYSNTTGNNNSAVGQDALDSNTTGSNNSAVGVQALLYNTTGYQNSAMGQIALQKNTTGYQNSAMGVSALYYNTTGYYNSALGFQALLNNTTGTSNSAMGLAALLSNTTGSGNSAFNPLNSAGSYAPVFNPTTENNRFCMGSTGVTNAYIQVAWTVVSDARDKTNFAPVPYGLEFVNQLKPTAYQFKEDRETDIPTGIVRYGFKAQDILELEGDTPVIIDTEDLDKLRFNESSLIPVLVNAIKELTARLELLEGK